MAAKSIKKNFIFNIIYQILVLLVPLVVAPYIARVLGVDGVGQYSYANSIVSYFILIAVLGTTTYGQRSIGYYQNDIEARSRAFWEVFIFRLITTLITMGLYTGYTFLIAPKTEWTVYLVLSLNIVNVVFDISWFMQGMEEFGKTATTSIVFRIVSVVSIFLFVKGPDDLWIYILFVVGYVLLGNLFLWIFLPKYLCKVKGIKPFRGIRSVIELFLPTIAIQIYTVLDKSMIGWLTQGYTENGYYEQAEKIVKIALTAVTALGIVLIPRISKLFKEGDTEGIRYYVYKSYRFVWMMAIPITFGLAAVASVFVPVFLGEGYDKCSVLIPILSSLTIFIGLSHVTNLQYLIPVGKQNVIILTSVTGAIVNVILNLILIPFFASIGAAIASVFAEFSVTLVGFIYIRKTKQYPLKQIFTCMWKYWIAAVLMTGVVLLIKYFVPIAVWSLIVLILSGAVSYFIVLLIMRDALLMEILSKTFGFLRRNKKATPNGDQTSETMEEENKSE